MDDRNLLEVSHLRTSFETKNGVLMAVNDINFSVKKGEVLGIVGESGCGKSVMSMSILKIIEKYGGKILDGSSVRWNGSELLELDEKKLCDMRGKEMAMIFQDPMTSLNPVFTVEYQLVEMIRRHQKIGKREAKGQALSLLTKVGIPDPEKRIREYPHQMSGGMRQRVVIAMALSCNPKLLIADEPTTALDVTIQAQIIDLLIKLREEYEAAIMLITHDLGVVAELADNIMVMYAGHVVEYGTKGQILSAPRHPYTKGLLASVPRLDTNTDRLNSIPGNVPNLAHQIDGCIFHDRCGACMERCQKEEPLQVTMEDGAKVSCWLYCGEKEGDPHG